ncbi:hypothetical protein EsDP_00005808 [Epichloe bromicola]|uniref:Ferric oxidoreductase domain-containing protein n=1 Tax=Epichloe bromicola TaxID=79588 RepID=A0ABQ0CVR9_9HYPO
MKIHGFFSLAFVSVFLSLNVSVSNASTGLIGHGTDLFKPVCAFACQNSISAPLNCTRRDAQGKDSGRLGQQQQQHVPSVSNWTITKRPTEECKAHNTYYRRTLAYCLQQHCLDQSWSDLELFWKEDGPRSFSRRIPTYRRTVAALTSFRVPPRASVNSSRTLDYVGYVPINRLKSEYLSLKIFVATEVTHQRYGLIIFLTCALIPVGLSLLRFLPWSPGLVATLRGYMIDPPLLGSKNSEPLGGFFLVPTRGQALFLLYVWGINVLLASIGYNCMSEEKCFSSDALSRTGELKSLGNRTGVLSLANLALAILFAGRNNFLLWVTNWSRTTFLLLHRWVGFICVVEALVHTFVYLYLLTSRLSGDALSELARQPYWIWGSVAVICLALLIVTSIHPIRRRFYECFVVTHIVITILALVGLYEHLITRYGHTRGTETWLYIAVGFWVFDRVMRTARYVPRGIRFAFITTIDEDYVRVDIPGVSARGHVYLHFLTISKWRVWESHPFSVGSVTTWQDDRPGPSPGSGFGSGSDRATLHAADSISFSNPFQPSAPRWSPQQAPRKSITASRQPGVAGRHPSTWKRGPGITVLIRRQNGLTALLKEPSGPLAGIPVLVEGSYNEGTTFLQDNHVRPTQDFPNMACIAGGVGITGVLPFLDKFDGLIRAYGTKKLFWVVRSMPLVHAVEDMLGLHGDGDEKERVWGDVDVALSVGARPNLMLILQELLRGQRGGTVVVVCGPPSMADEVRCCVAKISRRGGYDQSKVLVKLIVEAFSW